MPRPVLKEVSVPRAGGYQSLTFRRRSVAPPRPSDVVVQTEAIGVNYADCVVRMGLYASAKKYVGWPITPGFEFAGRVIEVGSAVESVSVGDRVFGVTRFGAYSTHVTVPEAYVRPLPDELTVTEAAAFPTVHLTAWFALRELVRLRSGQRVLIHSAAGGVGSAAVQIARRAGCEVTGVVGSTHKVAHVEALGADHVIDKSNGALWNQVETCAPNGYQVVLDANGIATLDESYRHLAPGGRLVVYGFHSMLPRGTGRPSWPKLAWDYLRTPRFSPLNMTTENRSVLAFNLSFLFSERELLAEALSELTGWLRDGSLRAPAITTLPLDAVQEAHRRLETGQTVGKLVLIP